MLAKYFEKKRGSVPASAAVVVPAAPVVADPIAEPAADEGVPADPEIIDDAVPLPDVVSPPEEIDGNR